MGNLEISISKSGLMCSPERYGAKPCLIEVLTDHVCILPQLPTRKSHTLQLYTSGYVQVIPTKSADSP